MDINEQFQLVITKLRDGKRPRLNYDQEKWSELSEHLKNQTPENSNHLLKLLCLLEHANPPYPANIGSELQKQLLREDLDSETVIPLLGVCMRVIVTEAYKKGNRVPVNFFKALETHITSNDLEIKEWVLRVIQECGTESVCLRPAIEKLELGWTQRFGQQGKTIKNLRDEILEKWENLPS